MSSVIALNQIDGSELWKKVGFKHSEKVLVALRGVYNLPFNLDDPVFKDLKFTFYSISHQTVLFFLPTSYNLEDPSIINFSEAYMNCLFTKLIS